MINSDDVIKELEERLSTYSSSSKVQNVGVVEKNTDGVISASGLSKVQMGEIVEFRNDEKGVVLNLDEDNVSIILLGKGEKIKEQYVLADGT